MRHAEEFCREHGKGGILLTTHVDNEIAQRLYRKVGYETIGLDSRGELLMIYRLKTRIGANKNACWDCGNRYYTLTGASAGGMPNPQPGEGTAWPLMARVFVFDD